MIDRLSVKMLKYIKKHTNVTLDDLKSKFGEYSDDYIRFLQKDNYIINDLNGYHPVVNGTVPIKTNRFHISPKGIAYLQETRIERRKYWVPIILSNLMAAAALVISISK